jgi:hypothetical protein
VRASLPHSSRSSSIRGRGSSSGTGSTALFLSKEIVLKCFGSRNASVGVELKHLSEQCDARWWHVRDSATQPTWLAGGVRPFVVGKGRHVGPVLDCWHTERVKDELELVLHLQTDAPPRARRGSVRTKRGAQSKACEQVEHRAKRVSRWSTEQSVRAGGAQSKACEQVEHRAKRVSRWSTEQSV